MAAVVLQSGFILQLRPYRETSLLLEVFTRDHGVVSMLARGVRKPKSALAGLLQPFLLLSFSYLDRSELKTLTAAEFVEGEALQRLALYCGFYVNELVQCFLHREDPHPQLFDYYRHCLRDLARSRDVEQVLRIFELQLLNEAGYGVELDRECRNGKPVNPQNRYRFMAGEGMVAAADGQVSGRTLELLAAGTGLDAAALVEAKILLRTMLDACLAGRILRSREVLVEIIKHLD